MQNGPSQILYYWIIDASMCKQHFDVVGSKGRANLVFIELVL